MPTLMQIVETYRGQEEGERAMTGSTRERIDLVSHQSHIGIGTQIGGDFISMKFLHPDLAGMQGRIRRLEFSSNLLPSERLLSEASLPHACDQEYDEATTSDEPAHESTLQLFVPSPANRNDRAPLRGIVSLKLDSLEVPTR